MPVFCNVLYATREEAQLAPCADIRLGFCGYCDLIYNVAFDAEQVAYCPDYENSLHFSAHFQQFAESKAAELIERYDLHTKDIVEIGCGQGDFLAMLAEQGNNRCMGYDPSFSPDKAQGPPPAENMTIIPELYSSAHAARQVDFICCRHVLEHIEKPLAFLQNLRQTIGDRPHTVVYFEVPNALYTLKDLGIWDIIYEHCSYYTATSLTELFYRSGFEPLRVIEQYGGQFLTLEAKPVSGHLSNSNKAGSSKWINAFQTAYEDKRDTWQQKMDACQAAAANVVLWGAGSKGVTFLNALKVGVNRVSRIVDLNPRKWDKFIAGTGQQIISPDQLLHDPPDVVIIMNPVYRNEIRAQLEKMGLQPALEVA